MNSTIRLTEKRLNGTRENDNLTLKEGTRDKRGPRLYTPDQRSIQLSSRYVGASPRASPRYV